MEVRVDREGADGDIDISSGAEPFRLDQRSMNPVAKAVDAKMLCARDQLLIDAGDGTTIIRDLIQVRPLRGEEYASGVADGFDDDIPVVPLMELAYCLGVV